MSCYMLLAWPRDLLQNGLRIPFEFNTFLCGLINVYTVICFPGTREKPLSILRNMVSPLKRRRLSLMTLMVLIGKISLIRIANNAINALDDQIWDGFFW